MLHSINQISQIQELSQLRAVTDDPNPWLLIAAGVVVVVLLAILLWPRVHGGSRRNGGDNASGADVSLAQQRSVERDMQTLMSELSEMARKIGAQLDAKSARLEALIRAADERAGRLETQLRGEPAPVSRRDGEPPTDNPGEAASFTASPPSIEIPPPSSEIDGDRRHVQVYALADQGLSPVQIAERLDLPEGEVELIIALRPRGRAAI